MRNKFFNKIVSTLVVVAGAVLALYFAKTISASRLKMNESAFTLQLGAPSLSKVDGLKTDNHPTGISFYDADFSPTDHKAITFGVGRHSFRLNNVTSLMGVADSEVPGGIFEWKILFAFSDKQAESPEVARDGMMQFLARLQAAGWQRYIQNHRPRLTGEQAWRYGTSGKSAGVYSLDPSYTPNLEEWIAAEDSMPSWTLYADGTYIKISLQASAMAGIAGKKTYLVIADVMNEYNFYAGGIFAGDEEKIRNWKTLLPAVLTESHAKRIASESALKAQGYTIDTTYQDPPIKALQDPASKPE